jgi:DNA-binding NarL/FixJ family response regulator
MRYRILILSRSPDDVRVLEHALGNARDGPFDVEAGATLAEGMRRLRSGGVDAILVDLDLPDSQGLSGFDQLAAAARHTPILTLCGLDDEADAVEAVQRGAQGWLSTGSAGAGSPIPSNISCTATRNRTWQGTPSSFHVMAGAFRSKTRPPLSTTGIDNWSAP